MTHGRLIITRGLPGSGKTSWAQLYVQDQIEHGNTKIINLDRDMFRESAGLGLAPGNYESTVSFIIHNTIEQGLRKGFTVIESSTNLKASGVKDMLKIANYCGAEVKFEDFDTSVTECIARDFQRGNAGGHSVGHLVIQDMAKRLMPKGKLPPIPVLDMPEYGQQYIADTTKPAAYIFDIDGTVAHNDGHRSPYVYDEVFNDSPRNNVIDILHILMSDADIIFLSGRESACRKDTIRWIEEYIGLQNPPLFMRNTGDSRKDYIIKQELFDENIRHNYNVLGVFDDRRQVVDAWRAIGLLVCDVAGNTF